MYELQVRTDISVPARENDKQQALIANAGHRPLIVAVESRRGFGGDGSGGADSGSLFGCSSILSISRLASSHASRFCERDSR